MSPQVKLASLGDLSDKREPQLAGEHVSPSPVKSAGGNEGHRATGRHVGPHSASPHVTSHPVTSAGGIGEREARGEHVGGGELATVEPHQLSFAAKLASFDKLASLGGRPGVANRRSSAAGTGALELLASTSTRSPPR